MKSIYLSSTVCVICEICIFFSEGKLVQWWAEEEQHHYQKNQLLVELWVTTDWYHDWRTLKISPNPPTIKNSYKQTNK